MMAYGLGEDRLGGAKMNYIDTNILVKIVDSTKEMYVVQLSSPFSRTQSSRFLRVSGQAQHGFKGFPFVSTGC